MMTEKMSGFFDCRVYDKRLERKDRKLKGEGDNLTFNTTFALVDLPDAYKVNGAPDVFVKTYASKDERERAAAEGREAKDDRAAVKFKIGGSTRWFDKYGKACQKPENATLDDGRYEVQIEFRRKEKDPADDKKPSGYWANAIMFCKVDDNPFAGAAFEIDTQATQAPTPQADEIKQELDEVLTDDVPF